MHEMIERIRKLVRSGKTNKASVLATRLTSDYASEPRAWRERAFVKTMQGHHAASISDMSKAIALNEFRLLDDIFSRGVSSFKLGRYKRAVTDFSRTIALGELFQVKSQCTQAHFFPAECYVRLKKFRQARLDCGKVPAEYQTWTYGLRSKRDVLADCGQLPK